MTIDVGIDRVKDNELSDRAVDQFLPRKPAVWGFDLILDAVATQVEARA